MLTYEKSKRGLRFWEEYEASLGLGVPQQDPHEGAQSGREEEEA